MRRISLVLFFLKINDQRMLTLIAKKIFYWRLDTKILGEDWILQDSAASPRPRNFYEVGIGNGSAGEGF